MKHQSGYTLYLHVHSAREVARLPCRAYSKVYLGTKDFIDGSATAGASITHGISRTKVVATDKSSGPTWNHEFQLDVVNPETEILTIRVKSKRMLYCPAIGACAIPLCNVSRNILADQWFPLYKGYKSAGSIRLQLLLKARDERVCTVNASLVQQRVRPQERDAKRRGHSDEHKQVDVDGSIDKSNQPPQVYASVASSHPVQAHDIKHLSPKTLETRRTGTLGFGGFCGYWGYGGSWVGLGGDGGGCGDGGVCGGGGGDSGGGCA
ncbi:hypothetical protein PsorP6_017081 [Peronosclerospora sorghi]|uniref:Uncharacterized protein n=1 Tax=Peronosclerospora sorghi TaxID=230839 RepID=A0ACC0WC60_9STRA|nr:hypothetical protein PsorP6_017081 [Peronosclerospora sorghi]